MSGKRDKASGWEMMSRVKLFAAQKQKWPGLSNEAFYLAEQTGLSYTSAGRGIACKRFPSRPAGSRAGDSLRSACFCCAKTKTPRSCERGVLFGGADGALLHKRRPRNRLQAIPFSPRREPRRRLPPLRMFLLRKNKNAPFLRTRRFIWRSGRGSNPRPPA